MPFIHVKSLPLSHTVHLSVMLESLARDFADATGVAVEHVTTTWEFFEPGCYTVGARAAHEHQTNSHPLLVDLLAPDFNDPQTVEKMLLAVANSLAKRAHVPITNIFINYRPARSAQVFDAGTIVRW